MEIITTDRVDAPLMCGVKRREFLKGTAILIPAVVMAKKGHAGWPAVVVAISGAIVAAIEIARFIQELLDGNITDLKDENGSTVVYCIGCEACISMMQDDEDYEGFADAVNTVCPVAP